MPSTAISRRELPGSLLQAADAVARILRRARAQVQTAEFAGAPPEQACRIVEHAATQIGSVRLDGDCVSTWGWVLVDWRDRLSSHVLAARAVDDVGIEKTVSFDMLQRGLEEISADLAQRLRARPTPSPAALA